MPPINSIIKGKNTLFDKVRVFGAKFFGVVACNDAEEGQIALDVFAPNCEHMRSQFKYYC